MSSARLDASEQFRELLGELLAKSREDAVPWREDSSGGFVAKFPETSITVGFASPNVEADRYFATLDRGGRTVLKIEEENEGSDLWQGLAELYNEARRLATGWDQAIAETRAALQKGWGEPTSGQDQRR